jgi:hypothetical protein
MAEFNDARESDPDVRLARLALDLDCLADELFDAPPTQLWAAFPRLHLHLAVARIDQAFNEAEAAADVKAAA